jgi:hypothetical protein
VGAGVEAWADWVVGMRRERRKKKRRERERRESA